jgi:hypothetical protein
MLPNNKISSEKKNKSDVTMKPSVKKERRTSRSSVQSMNDEQEPKQTNRKASMAGEGEEKRPATSSSVGRYVDDIFEVCT